MDAKESAIAKSRGSQDERDMSPPDAALLHVLYNKKKISKDEANYVEKEGKCHVVEGQINNEKGVSKFFSPKGEGMLPGDIVWMYVKKSGKKLKYEEGYVIEEGAPGFQCKDCKYYLYSGNCLFIEGKFKPEMSCGFIVKIGHGTEI